MITVATNNCRSSIPKDISWREYNIHDDDGEDAEAAAAGFFFETMEEKEMLREHDFVLPVPPTSKSRPESKQRTFRLIYQEDWNQSTGMSICLGSEILAQSLVRNPNLVQGKKVLELGAGVGLGGLAAYCCCQASQVIWTDGDVKVLENLRHNIRENAKLTKIHHEQHLWCSKDVDPAQVCCPQLIWGKDAKAFRKTYGRFQVILGADCFYMKKSLAPLFETVDQLLDEGGIFIALNPSATQSPIENILQVAAQHGFEWKSSPAYTMLSPSGGAQQLDGYNDTSNRLGNGERIYVFTKKRWPSHERSQNDDARRL